MNFIESAKKIISIESSPEFGTKDTVNYLSSEIQKYDFLSCEIMPSQIIGKEHCNILVSPKNNPKKENGLLLVTHLDTTDPGSYGLWEKTARNPFSLSIYGDDIYGLGVATKLDFLCMLEALLSVKDKRLKRPIYLLGTHSEENGLKGIQEFLGLNKFHVESAVVAHPTDLSIYNKGLGISVVEIDIPFSEEEKLFHKQHNESDNSMTQSKVFRGRGTHSSNPDQGESAIVKLFEFLKKMPQVAIMSIDGGILHNTVPEHSMIEFVMNGTIKNNILDKLLNIYNELGSLQEKLDDFPQFDFSSKGSRLTIGKVRSSEQGITMTGNCRLLPSVPEKEYRSWLLHLKEYCDKRGMIFKLKQHIPSFYQNEESTWSQYGAQTLENIKIKNLGESDASIMCTEANLLKKSKIDSFLFGAGIGPGNTHQPDEKNSLSKLSTQTNFYKNLLEKYCE